ncbi:hypothetical protein [uncultured Eubacterium sp.]|uniref:hypothetical protein n=1 Tax=uncultured Eubacterium sp. TaxID=165185 RepID=UPI0025CDBFB6|nr:hypothetical protein [uncultured Eubacterium sp.]
MASRLELQKKLEELLGTRHVYYQSPASVKMEYPAIVYSQNSRDIRKADNSSYTTNTRYAVTVIDKRPDNSVIEKLLELQYCSYDRQYIADNLYHDVLTLYF